MYSAPFEENKIQYQRYYFALEDTMGSRGFPHGYFSELPALSNSNKMTRIDRFLTERIVAEE